MMMMIMIMMMMMILMMMIHLLQDNYVSLVLGLGGVFGSGFFSQGLLLNNAMASFHLPAGEDGEAAGEAATNNRLAGGRRPLASAAPVVVLNTRKVCDTRVVAGGAEAVGVAQV